MRWGKTRRAEAKVSARTLSATKVENEILRKGKVMKTLPYKRRVCKFRLELPVYGSGYFLKMAGKLERTLARKPQVLQMEMIGVGEIPADTALLMRSILMKRLPSTRLVTNARSSLTGGSVLIWLLGNERTIREDARVFFRRDPLEDEDPVEVYAGLGAGEPKYKDSYSSIDPEDADYVRVLQLIDEFLPVKEFAGKVVSVAVLREFGLIENERVDDFLAAAFSKSERSTVFT